MDLGSGDDEVTSVEPTARENPFDDLVADLQELRLRAGEPSYAEIAARIARLRTARGATATARVGRTTVYDAFRVGRRRIDHDLVLDIVRTLGVDEDEVGRWRERALAAQRANRARHGASASAGEPAAERALVSTGSTDEARTPVAQPATTTAVARSARFISIALVLCVTLNLVGRVVVDAVELSIFLDMTGTAVSAVLLGPWWAALVGLLSNVLGVASSGWTSAAFTPVNVVGGLVWGYGYHRFGMGRSLLRFSLLNLIAGAVCALVAVVIVLTVFGGFTSHDSSEVARALYSLVPSMPFAVVTTNLLLSTIDKTICGYLALIAREAVDASSRRAAGPS